MIEFELDSDFVLVVKISMSGILSIKKFQKNSKMKMKNEEEENQLPVQLVYNYNFHRGDFLILEH